MNISMETIVQNIYSGSIYVLPECIQDTSGSHSVSNATW